MKRFDARVKVIEKLKSQDLWVGMKPHKLKLPLCSRTGDLLEPRLKDQWFVKVDEIFKASGEAVANGTMKLIPQSRVNLWSQYVKTFTKDWCISRQLWWGHQI